MRCYSHLSDDEREQIGLAKALGHSIGAIAQAIGRPKSTISRELSLALIATALWTMTAWAHEGATQTKAGVTPAASCRGATPVTSGDWGGDYVTPITCGLQSICGADRRVGIEQFAA